MLGILTGFGGEISTFCIDDETDQVRGIVVGSLQHLEQVTRAIEANSIKPIIDQAFSLPQLSEAFKFHAEGKHFGKVIVTF